MKHFTLSLLAILFTTVLFGQGIVYDPIEVTAEGNKDDFSIDGKFDVQNPNATAVSFIWELERNDVPSEWVFTICDKNLCYAPGNEACPTDRDEAVNHIDANDAVTGAYKVTLSPKGVPYDGYVTFKAFERGNPSNVLGNLRINFNVGMTSSTFDLNQSDIVVYPNPTADYFQIKNEEDISSLTMYNIVGKEIMTYNHVEGRIYDISDLEVGMYLVRFFDNEGNAIKASRITKK